MSGTKNLFILCFLIFCCSLIVKAETPMKSVKIFEAKEQAFFETYVYPARVDFDSVAIVQAPIEGEIIDLPVTLGQRVTKNSVLMSIKNTDPLFQYRAAKVKSPIDGIISEIMISKNSNIGKDQVLLKIAKENQYQISAEVPASNYHFFKGLPAGEISLQNKADENKVKIKTMGISPQLDPATGTARVLFEIERRALSEQNFLTPGRLARVSFKGPETKGIVVPEVALNYKGKKVYLALVVDNKYVKKEVQLGDKRDGMALITTGLTAGDKVVERASGFILEGTEVKVME